MTATALKHGVYTNQIPTSILTPRESLSALPIVFGCAPIHRLTPDKQTLVQPGQIAMIYDLEEAGRDFGIDVQRDDFERWTLSETAYIYLQLFSVAPVIFANLFDPAVHRTSVAAEAVALTTSKGRLQFPDVLEATLKSVDGTTTYSAGTDYYLNAITGEITVLEGGALEGVTALSANYAYAAPEKVTVAECVGGYDVAADRTTGLQLIDDVFPRFRQFPAIGLAPKFGEDPVVAALLAEKMKSVNALARGIAVADIPTTGTGAVKKYTDAGEYKNRNNLVLEDLVLCWGKVKLAERVMRLSTQAAALMAQVDAEHNGIPYASPSNHNLQMTAFVVDGEEKTLDIQKANHLNGNGVVTALNMYGGWKLWGNWTAAYPENRDPKDYFITHRRMMAWYGNSLTLTWWEKLDFPMTRRLVETIVNSEQIRLNSLAAGEALHGGGISLRAADNSIQDLMGGKIVFHVKLGLVPPAKEIVFDLEYDPTAIEALFQAVG